MCLREKVAFTLVELAIVLVIIGLLVGGILAGQTLIHAAELRGVSSEFLQYKTAVAAFRLKYNGLPGDIKNATSFWGQKNDCEEDATDARTCNGDGDGEIANASNGLEGYTVWQHLANSGLIAGTYTGTWDQNTGYGVAGRNVPKSRLPNVAWGMVASLWLGSGNITLNKGPFRSTFELGYAPAMDPTSYPIVSPVIKPVDAFSIDSKLDDGNPSTGIVLTQKAATPTPNCANAMNDGYISTNDAFTCHMYFRSGF